MFDMRNWVGMQIDKSSCSKYLTELSRLELMSPLPSASYGLSFTLLSGKLNIPSLSESGFTGFQDFQDYELDKPLHLHH